LNPKFVFSYLQVLGLSTAGLREEGWEAPAPSVMMWWSWVLSMIRLQGYHLPSFFLKSET
jgi:hypothetical protein